MTYNCTTTPAEDDPEDDLDEFDDTNDANNDATNTELAKLGVQSTDADKYKTRVLREEGLIDDGPSSDKAKAQNMDRTVDTTKKKNDIIYSASAPGFNVGSQADSGRVVNVENSDMVGLDITEASTAGGDENEMFEEADLYRIQAELAQQNSALVAEMNKADRVANSITDQMYSECQELLQLFGIPWIVSPTEAESQCAWLDENGLTQGTITDDSDIWLFGGRRVYKNFFNQEKFVEMFKNEEISHHFGLNREKLILLAMLTGSDYTEGVEGVGPVTALEVLAEFPGDGLFPLIEFKSWWSRVHQEYGKEFGMPIGNSTREKLRKLKLSPGFPSEQVMSAYLDPKIDHDKAKFSWSIPNFVALRDFAQERFGWAKLQVDELIQPVIRSLKSSNHQGRIDSFFTSYRTNLPEKGLQSSKRVNEALRKVKGLPSPIKPTSTKQVLPSKSNAPATSSKSSTTIGKKSGKVNKKSRAVIDIEASGSKVEKVPDQSPVANEASTSNNQPSSQSSSSKQDVSLIANSCGFVINASKDDIILQREERKRKEKEARERAAEIWKKAQQQKNKKKFKRPSRVKLADQHHLSDEEDD
jgi:DNA excision repair protein ERCC-5